jgi:hypothetical protein
MPCGFLVCEAGYLCSTLQKVFVYILVIALLGQTFGQGLCYVGYLVEKQEYIKRCVNKARPQMRCNGKCQLMKKMQEQQQQEQGPIPQLKLVEKTNVISSKSFFPIYVCDEVYVNANIPLLYSIGSPIDYSASLFHPPNEQLAS